MADFLVVTDVDSTLIADEVIELLADEAGTREQVAAVTASAMRGEIDFAESLRRRVATLAGLPASVIERTVTRVRLSPGAEQLIAAVHERGGAIGAISGGFVQVLQPLAQRIGLDRWRANTLEVTGRALTGRVTGPIVDAERKRATLAEWAAEFGVSQERTVAIGDGANDLLMLGAAGISIGYCAKPVVAAAVQHHIDVPDLSQAIEYLPTH